MHKFLVTKNVRSELLDLGLAATSGLLLTTAFPKFDLGVLAWIAFIPLFWAIQGKSSGTGFRLGLTAGIIHYITLLYWITGVMKTYGGLPALLSWGILFLLVFYLSLYLGMFCALLVNLKNRSYRLMWIAPVLWVGLEYLRALFLSGFPWENLGYSQYTLLPLIQISDIFGVYGLSALVMVTNLVLFETWRAIGAKRTMPWKAILIVALFIGAAWVYGNWRLANVTAFVRAAPELTVALVQGNIDQAKKWDPAFQLETLDRYERLTRRSLPKAPTLVIWPETALPFYLFENRQLTHRFLEIVRNAGTNFLVGSPSFSSEDGQTFYHNSAYLLGPEGNVLGRYDKVHLVPYGEYVPLKGLFPFLGKVVQAVGDFVPGRKGQVLSTPSAKVGVLICFEVIFPELARVIAENGAQFLINITNDAWFGRSSAPHQHFSMAVFRAVETRRAMTRAANTGISAIIDPLGRVSKTTPLFEEAVATASVPLLNQQTVYVNYGHLFEKLCLGLLALCTGWRLHAAYLRKRVK